MQGSAKARSQSKQSMTELGGTLATNPLTLQRMNVRLREGDLLKVMQLISTRAGMRGQVSRLPVQCSSCYLQV